MELNTNYCIAKCNKEGIHLNPLSHALQIRPDFSKVETDIKKKKNEKNDKLFEVVEFHKNKLKDGSEEWVDVIQNESPDADKLLESNSAKVTEALNPDNYYAMLLDQIKQEKISLEKAQSSALETANLSFEEKLVSLLKRHKIVGLMALRTIGGELEDSEILKKAEKYVDVLVNGTLTLSSEFLDENDPLKDCRDKLLTIMQETKGEMRKNDLFSAAKDVSLDKVNLFMKEYCKGLLGKWKLINSENPEEMLISEHNQFYQRKAAKWGLSKGSFSSLVEQVKKELSDDDCLSWAKVKKIYLKEGGKEPFEEFVKAEMIETEGGLFFKGDSLKQELVEMMNFKGKMSFSAIKKSLSGSHDDVSLTETLKKIAVPVRKSWILKECNLE